MVNFQVLHTTNNCQARLGKLKTAHGTVHTPVFMPVGTQGSVKTLTPEELLENNVEIILGNTYHLYLRPGIELIRSFGGLHGFMNWNKPILTDSGGFQIFSQSALRKLEATGVRFKSFIDGSEHFLTPEDVLQIQEGLNSDIIMVLDECPPFTTDKAYLVRSLELTTQWARRTVLKKQKNHQLLFGIIQGGTFTDLRGQHYEQMKDLGFDGFAMGGLSVGEPTQEMYRVVSEIAPQLDPAKPRYLMGVGSPENIVECVGAGIDMLDCVFPTRLARNGSLLTKKGRINIRNSVHKSDKEPLEAGCGCYTCRNFSKAYLRHLFIAKELLAYRLNTLHNIYYYTHLIADIRTAIAEDRYPEFKKAFYQGLESLKDEEKPVL